MAMEKADDPRVQWRVVVAAMPRTSVGCSKNLYHLRLEIAFVVPVLTIPLGHYILQSHP